MMEHLSPKPIRLVLTRSLLALILALMLALSGATFHLDISSANGNFPQRTDQEAGCNYGTQKLADWKIPEPGSFTSVHQGRGFGIDPSDPCFIFLYWTSEVGPSSSFSAAMVNSDAFFNGKSTLCSSASDPACQPSAAPNGQFRHLGGFYKCETEADRNCIASVTVTLADGSKVAATFDRHFPDVPMIPASNSPLLSYPKSGPPTLWSYQSGGTKRLLYLQGVIERSWNNRGGRWAGPAATLNFAVQPVELKTGVRNAIKPTLQEIPFTTPDGGSGSRIEFTTGDVRTSGDECPGSVATDTDACLIPVEFPANERYQVTFQVTKDMSFFLNGRLDAPIVYTEELGDGKRLVIDGAPATLFSVSGSIPKRVLDEKAIAAIRAARSDFGRNLGFAPSDFPPMDTGYPDLLSALLPYFGDRTTFNLRAWTLRSSANLGNFAPGCYERSRGEILGIISTNATAFIGDPPTLDPRTNTLGYKVAAPHFAPDGKTENIGRYYMNMNSNFTQCILGVEKVPSEATVGISYGQGRELVSTVSVKQDKDWLRLQADNFTFSAPEVKVTFPRASSSSSGSNANGSSSSVSGVSAREKSITCVKGKKSRTVTAVKPKCPKGWKKK
ncbi:MAG: hypothetical protein ACO3QV_03755 [Candidatus Nanopelagicaceae bacterium]